MDWMFSSEIWVALFTLATLEIVLGIDNLVFISIAVSRLPPERRPAARKFGLALACVTRIMLLVSLAFLARMQHEQVALLRVGGVRHRHRALLPAGHRHRREPAVRPPERQ